MTKTWLPLDAVLAFLSDTKYKTFAEILGATGDNVQHERASRMYMSSGVGRKKNEDGTEKVVSLEELQRMSGLTLPEIIRKGRRRAIYETISKLLNAGAIECKDIKQDPDLREYRAVKDWKPKPRGNGKVQEEEDQVSPGQQPDAGCQVEAQVELPPERKKRRGRPRLDEALEPEESTPKVPFPIPKHVKDLVEYVELIEMGFPMAFKAVTNGDRNDFFRACRELKRILIANVFVPAPIEAQPTVSLPVTPVSTPIQEPPPAIQGGAEK